jgi:flavin-dependent dehydrogenase
VLLIEKARFPRDKVCGDALTYRAIPLVREIFPELAWLTPSKSFTTKQVLFYPGGHMLRREAAQLDVIPREVFDTALWNAIAGSRIDTLEDSTVNDLLFEGGHAVGVRVVTPAGTREIRCRWLLGADGSHSVVRRRTGPVDRDVVIYAVRQYVRGIEPSLDALLFFFDIEKNGYFWIFPFERNGERWANVGYGNSFAPVSLKARLQEYCATPEVRRFLGTGEPVGKITGFPLNVAPVRWGRVRLARSLAGAGYLLLGDAASLIHPLSGEGIAFAIQSGKLAAEVLHDPRIADSDKGRVYERRVLAYVTPFFTALSAFCAIRMPVLLPRPASELYLRSAAWLQARTGWGVK